MTLVALQGGTSGNRPQVHVRHALGTPGEPLRTKQTLLGMSLFHFGGFLFRSWRANDWMFGRLHAATAISQMLLSHERLHDVGASHDETGRRERALAFANSLMDGLDDDPRALQELSALVKHEEGLLGLVSDALDPTAPAGTIQGLQTVAAWRIQVEVLREELPTIACEVERDRAKGARMPVAVPRLTVGRRVYTGKVQSRWVRSVPAPGTTEFGAGAALRAFEGYNLAKVAGLKRQYLSAPFVSLVGRSIYVSHAALSRPMLDQTPGSLLRRLRPPTRGILRLLRSCAPVPVAIAGGLPKATVPATVRSFLVTVLVAYLLAMPATDAVTLLGLISAALLGVPWLLTFVLSVFSSASGVLDRLGHASLPGMGAVAGVLVGVALRHQAGFAGFGPVIPLLTVWLAAMGAIAWWEGERGIDPLPSRPPAPCWEASAG